MTISVEPVAPPERMPFISSNPGRDKGESYEQYRKRIALVRRVEKKWLAGRTVWASKENGTDFRVYGSDKKPVGSA
jgi:hypothetical protein